MRIRLNIRDYSCLVLHPLMYACQLYLLLKNLYDIIGANLFFCHLILHVAFFFSFGVSKGVLYPNILLCGHLNTSGRQRLG